MLNLKNPSNTRLAFIMGCTAILWGVWVGNPWFDTFYSSLTYSRMARVAHEWQWGTLVLTFGILQVVCVFCDGRYQKVLAIIGIFLWLSISLLMGIGNIFSTGWTAYFIYAILNFLIFIGQN